MKLLSILLCCALVSGCAGAPKSTVDPAPLLLDHRFAPPSEVPSAEAVFALSDAMRRYLTTDIVRKLKARGAQQGLVSALYERGDLKLEYDSVYTRNAAQAFEARSGNCLSLVIMTAAFARELGLKVDYRTAQVDEVWSRSGDLYFGSGHVNITLGRSLSNAGYDLTQTTIDFLPPEQLRGLRTRPLDEQTLLAMFMNNRAAESLVAGRIDDAYWWAREAVLQQPAYTGGWNTLGVVYRRHGDTAQAEAVFRHVVAHDADNTFAIANLANLLEYAGRGAEASALRQQLARIEPYPAFHFFNLGQAAMRRGDYEAARSLFAKEVDRAGYYHEFHFWLAMAHFRLGDLDATSKHLKLAAETSTRPGERSLYAGKLAALKARHP